MSHQVEDTEVAPCFQLELAGLGFVNVYLTSKVFRERGL
jgi:hypothetical protein